MSRTDQIVSYLRENTDVKVVYPKDALLGESDTHQVWLKYDTHWNDIGAFVGAMTLLEAEGSGQVKSLDEVLITQDGLRGGDLANMLGQAKRLNDDINYKIEGYYDDVSVETAETVEQSNLNFTVLGADDRRQSNPDFTGFREDARGDFGFGMGKTVLYIGDSFLGSMEQYLSKAADESIFVHRENYEKLGRDLITEKQPDIIVFQTAERFIDYYDEAMVKYAGIIGE